MKEKYILAEYKGHYTLYSQEGLIPSARSRVRACEPRTFGSMVRGRSKTN